MEYKERNVYLDTGLHVSGKCIAVDMKQTCTFFTFVENGQMGGILMGIVTSRDIDFVNELDMSRPIKEVGNPETFQRENKLFKPQL